MASKKSSKKVATKAGTLSPLRVGQAVFIRTVTMALTGRVVEVGEHEIVLSNAAWIADTGVRFSAALAGEPMSEIEKMPGHVAVGRGAIVDVCEWSPKLPDASR